MKHLCTGIEECRCSFGILPASSRTANLEDGTSLEALAVGF